MLTSSPTRPMGNRPASTITASAGDDGGDVGVPIPLCTLAATPRQESVAGHRSRKSAAGRAASPGRPKIGPRMMPIKERRQRGQAHGVDANRDRIRNIELVVGHDAGQHEADRHVEYCAYDKRSENPDRHVALRILAYGRAAVKSRQTRYRRRTLLRRRHDALQPNCRARYWEE